MSDGALKLPRQLTLSDGSELTLRLLRRVDVAAFLAFTQSLPDHDLLFLRTDITDAGIVADWLDNIEAGRIVTIVAERDGRIFGYGSLHLSNTPWSQHVGALRVLISDEMRGKGLGRALTDAIFAQALDRGIEKMVEGDRYCIDILTQVAAANTALESLAFKILDEHVRHCVAGALQSGDAADAATKTEELLEAVQRFARTR